MELPGNMRLEPVAQSSHGVPTFMDFEEFTRLVTTSRGVEELHLHGQHEPMWHPRFLDMVAYASHLGILVSTESTLGALGPRRAEQLIRSGLHVVHVPLAGATEETWGRLGGRMRFHRVVRNIQSLLDARERLGTRLPRLRLTVAVTPHNVEEIPDVVRLARHWEAEGVTIPHACRVLQFDDEARLTRCIQEAQRVAGELRVDLQLIPSNTCSAAPCRACPCETPSCSPRGNP
ncbi:MAG: radical SAM protein [Myxococcota bacterium]